MACSGHSTGKNYLDLSSGHLGRRDWIFLSDNFVKEKTSSIFAPTFREAVKAL